jgi:hypothetical protein
LILSIGSRGQHKTAMIKISGKQDNFRGECYNLFIGLERNNFIIREVKNYEITRRVRYEFDDEASPENAGADGQRNETDDR